MKFLSQASAVLQCAYCSPSRWILAAADNPFIGSMARNCTRSEHWRWAVRLLEHPHTPVREGGERGRTFVVNMTESSQVAEIAKRFFFGLNARIDSWQMNDDEGLQIGW